MNMDVVPPELPPGIDHRPGRGYRARVSWRGQRASRTFATLAAAVVWRQQALDALRIGAAPPAPAPPPVVADVPTIEDAARALGRGILAGTVRNGHGRPYKPAVSRRLESSLRVHVLPRIGATPVADLGRRHVQVLVDELAAERGAETARKALHALSVVCRLAVRDGLIEANPAHGVRVPSDGRAERPVRILTPAECAALLDAAAADDARQGRSLAFPLVALLLGSGARSGEALGARWGSGLDLDAGVLRVVESLDRVRGADGSLARVDPKSRAGVREVPLAPSDVAILRRHRLASGRLPDGTPVFADARGEPLAAGGAPRRSWERVVRAAGIAEPMPTLHHLRHAWAVAMLRAGVRPEALAKLGGWADVGIIHRRYGRHALPDELADAGQRLEAWRAAQAGASSWSPRGPGIAPTP